LLSLSPKKRIINQKKMKAKISLIAIIMAGFILFAACGSTGGGSTVASSPMQSAAYNSGSAAGSSLLGLYSQYKSTGKIDFQSANTYLQLLTLATNVQTIKANAKNTTFYSQFAQGAIFGSQQKVNNNNVGSVISALTGLDLSGITGAGSASNVSNSTASNVLNGLTGLFGLLGK
jgi:hypothetical protein